MPINEHLIKLILEQLDDKYPHPIEDHDHILPDHENREEILDNLYHCLKKGWIEVVKTIDIDQEPLPVGYYKISISELGKKYFPAL